MSKSLMRRELEVPRISIHIRILDKSAKAMLAHTGLPKDYWSDAHETANYIYNRSPTKALTKMKSLVERSGEDLLEVKYIESAEVASIITQSSL